MFVGFYGFCEYGLDDAGLDYDGSVRPLVINFGLCKLIRRWFADLCVALFFFFFCLLDSCCAV